MRPSTALALAALSLGATTCARERPVALAVRSPAGMDPFTMGADSVRLRFENDGTEPQEVRLGAGGTFTLELRPSDPNAAYRVRVEALRAGAVVGLGVTPPVVWNNLVADPTNPLVVLVQPRDTLVRPPGATSRDPNAALRAARAELQLRAGGVGGVLAVTLPAGATMDAPVEGYDLLAHKVRPYEQLVPAEFDGDTDVIPVSGAYLLLRAGSGAIYSNASTPVGRDIMTVVPEPRRGLRASTVAEDALNGGAWLLGGLGDRGPSRRVDRVTLDAASVAHRFVEPAPSELSVARARPAVIALRAGTVSANPRWLVAFGQSAGEGAFELYESGTAPIALRTGDASIDQRTDGAVCCIAVDTFGCSRVLVLGGRLADGSLAPRDALLDGACLRESTGDASRCVLSQSGASAWMSVRRHGHSCAFAEGGRVLIAGGRNATEPVRTVETVDVTAVEVPVAGRALTEIVASNPALLPLADGSVLVAGGRDLEGRPSTDLWIYRY